MIESIEKLHGHGTRSAEVFSACRLARSPFGYSLRSVMIHRSRDYCGGVRNTPPGRKELDSSILNRACSAERNFRLVLRCHGRCKRLLRTTVRERFKDVSPATCTSAYLCRVTESKVGRMTPRSPRPVNP